MGAGCTGRGGRGLTAAFGWADGTVWGTMRPA